MNIRRMNISDHPGVKELWGQCGIKDEPEDSIEDMTLFLTSPTSAGFVAIDDGMIIGAVLCGHDGRYGYIHHLAVTVSSRNTGIGKKLVEACANFLNKRHIIIMVRDSNETGNGFWRQMNYRRVDGLSVRYCGR